jgi:hypothetical protein
MAVPALGMAITTAMRVHRPRRASVVPGCEIWTALIEELLAPKQARSSLAGEQPEDEHD